MSSRESVPPPLPLEDDVDLEAATVSLPPPPPGALLERLTDGPVRTHPPLDLSRVFEGARVLVVGGTGFLGKVWLSFLLSKWPSIGKILLVVRSRKDVDSEARFWASVASSEPFSPLRELHPGGEFDAFLREKVQVLDADVSKDLCGFTPETIQDLNGTVDAVVNVAGVVDFDPPLDEAILTNARGMQNLVALAQALGDVPVLHTSTCYVAGYQQGRIEEVDPKRLPFPHFREMPDAKWDPQREIVEGLELAASVRRRADDAHWLAHFERDAKAALLKRHEPTTGEVFDAEVRRAKERWIADETGRVGTERAKFWGWTNTYTYTKSLGEQVLARSGLRYTIVRPAVIESSERFPFPGWNEGINTMAPITYLFMHGHIQVPAGEQSSLDIIPVDYVAGGMVAALGALLEDTHESVYQLGTSHTNPAMMHRIVEICGLYKRKHYQRKTGGNPWWNLLQTYWEPTPVSADEFRAHGAPAIAKAARTLSQLARKAAVGPAAMLLAPTSRALASYSDVAKRNGEIFSLFVPFMAETEYRFVTDNMAALRDRLIPADREAVYWHPEDIDWRVYLHEVQLPGLEKWVLPELDKRVNRPAKPQRAYDNLLDLLDEAADRHQHRPALLRMERDGVARVSYREMHARVEATAARLAAAGVKPGDRVVLCAGNHIAWPVAYFGILRAGAVAVPTDAAMEADALANVIRASKAVAAVVDEKSAERVTGLAVKSLEVQALTDEGEGLVAPERPRLTRDDLASVIYTSGTTGVPKGVMLSHGNFTTLLGALAPVFPLGEGDRTLSVLPLHHTFEFTCGMLLPLSRGGATVYLDELNGERLTEAMREAKVTAMVGVPALWQLLERRILQQVKDRGETVSAVFDMALALNRTLGRNVGFDVGRVLFGAVHERFGGKLRYLISGGAALPKETAALFQGIGLPLAEGYGLTEAAPVLSVAKASVKAKPGSVGPAIPGVEIKILNPDASGVGEVLARGPNVMKGYADDPDATAGAIDADGWLHTGDLGSLGRGGALTLVGRSKDVIVSASGENLYPDDVERALGDIEGIKELVVLGVADPKGGERAALLAVPDTEEVPAERRAEAREQAMKRLRAKVRDLPPAWQPAVVLPYDATLPRTATRKVKRGAVRPIVERLVSASAPARGASAPAGSTPVRAAVASLSRRDPATITAATQLRGDLGFDSLMAMELAVALEAAIPGAQVPSDLVGRVETVGDLERALHVEPNTAPKPLRRKDIDEGVAPRFTLPDEARTAAKGAIAFFQREFYGTVMRPRVTGRAYIPQNRNTIVVANHTSHLDMGLVKHALGRYGEDIVALAAKDYFFSTPMRRAMFENFTNIAALDRDAGLHQTLTEIGRILQGGRTVLIFPEGTRSDDGQIKKFKGAVGFLALHHEVDILPMWLGGAYESLPKHGKVPTKRELTARIGPTLTYRELRRLTAGMRPVEAARTVAHIAQEAVESLRDGAVLDLASRATARAAQPRKHPVVALFEDLPRRFLPGKLDAPVSFYFTLGAEPEAKWTVVVDASRCEVTQGKVNGGAADCVLKTSPELFSRIVREGWQPGPAEFMTGAVKSNDVSLLMQFTQAFRLGE
ncbi:MAG: AMP-binding protein [Polyangiales bacterium]